MNNEKRRDVEDKKSLICSCNTSIALRRDTFLEGMSISLQHVLNLVIHWDIFTTQTVQVNTNRNTIRQLQQKLRIVTHCLLIILLNDIYNKMIRKIQAVIQNVASLISYAESSIKLAESYCA
jgi:hypothetical protein